MGRLVPHVIISLLNRKRPILRSNGKLIRDYIYVEDVANAYISLMRKMINSKNRLFIYNIGSKENLTVNNLVGLITKLINIKKIKPIVKNSSKIEIYKQKLDCKKIKKEIGWSQKFDIKSSLISTIQWYKKNLNFFNGKII